jgi:large subunit ribosomal protein L21
VERLDGEVGQKVSFEEVLFLGDEKQQWIGSPTLGDTRVVGTIREQGKGEKILVFKFKRRKMYRRKRGHRQLFTRVQIEEIEIASRAQKKGKEVKQKTKKAPRKAKQGTKLETKARIEKAPRKKAEAKAKPAQKKTTAKKQEVKKKTAATRKKSNKE